MIQKLTLLFFSIFLFQLGNAQTLSDNIDISTSANGIVAFPSNAPASYRNANFVKYTKLTAPNGQAIHFVAQNMISDAQIIRARNILTFYLTNFSGAQYGSDKSAVMNSMGTNEAVLMLLNGSDTGNPPELPAQTLYQNEVAVEGHPWYVNNNYEHRDAAFEEILHLMHDTGIGVDGANTSSGALPAYQMEIRAAQTNALSNNFWGIGAADWITELTAENSLSQEYLAAVVDSYYGLWGPWTESTTHGMWGLYVSKTRAEIETEDPMGYALMPKYFSPFINVNMDIDPTFNGIFTMAFDAAQLYTHKSQYLQHTTLTGTNASGLKGNDQYNRLTGNSANNTLEGGKGNDRLDGAAGTDVAIFTGNFAEYTISNQTGQSIVSDNTADRDGVDTLLNIETMRFADGDNAVGASTTTSIDENNLLEGIDIYPNPASQEIQIKLENQPIRDASLEIINATGQVIYQQEIYQEVTVFAINALDKGIYFVKVQNDYKTATKKVMVH